MHDDARDAEGAGRRSLWRDRAGGVGVVAPAQRSARERSGSDVLLLFVTAVPVALISLMAVPPSGFERALVGVVDTVPTFLGAIWRMGVAALIIWCVVVTVVSAVRRRGDVLVDVGLSAVVGVTAALLLDRSVDGEWPSVSEALTGGSTGSIPLVAFALAAAVSSAAAPHLTRPARRLGRWIVGFSMVSVVLLGSTSPAGALASLLVGVAAAAAVHLALGSSTGRPTAVEVAEALAQLDVSVHDLVVAPRQRSGVLVVDGVDDDGAPVRVSVYGRDARDTALLNRAWRAMWYRHGQQVVSSRLQQVEHEGFMAFLAKSRSVAVPDVVVAGRTARNDALIVQRGAGPSLVERLGPPAADAQSPPADGAPADAVPANGVPDGAALAAVEPGAIWDLISSLHDAGLVHGELSAESIAIDADGGVLLAELAPVGLAVSDDERLIDLAQTLVTTAVLGDVDSAVTAAREHLGAERLGSLLAYLQVPALGVVLRRQVKAAKLDMDQLRSAAAEAAGVDEPEIAKMRRVSPQTILSAGLLVLVAFGLIAAFGQVDMEELGHELAAASPFMIAATVLLAQLPFFSQAISTIGACPRPIPYGPVAVLQFAIGFVALAVPSTAGRVALGIRFFQRQGIPAGSAVSISAIDSFSGFLVQMLLLLVTLVFGVGKVDLSFDTASTSSISDLSWILVVAAAVLIVLVVLAIVMKGIRQRIWDRVKPFVDDARDALRSLRSPSKLLQLFGGNLLNQVIMAMALGLALRTFGGQLNLSTLIVIYVGAALFGGFMPVPGGIGVMEAALIAGLVAGGIESTTATATALLFRGATFYLPPLWGWFAMRWLQRHSYL